MRPHPHKTRQVRTEGRGDLVHPMRPHRQINIGQLTALLEHRSKHHGVGGAGAAPLGIIDHHNITGMKVFSTHSFHTLVKCVAVGAQEGQQSR